MTSWSAEELEDLHGDWSWVPGADVWLVPWTEAYQAGDEFECMLDVGVRCKCRVECDVDMYEVRQRYAWFCLPGEDTNSHFIFWLVEQGQISIVEYTNGL